MSNAEDATSMVASSVSRLKRPLMRNCCTHIRCSRPNSCAPSGQPSSPSPTLPPSCPPLLLALLFVVLNNCATASCRPSVGRPQSQIVEYLCGRLSSAISQCWGGGLGMNQTPGDSLDFCATQGTGKPNTCGCLQ